jgi:hypothetical protein
VDAAGVKEGGAGILNAEQPRLRRYKNVPDVAEYTCRLTPAALTDESPAAPSGLTLAEIEAEFVEGDTLSLELILMQLRLNEGLSIADFATRTGVDPLRIFEPSLSRLVEQGSVEVNERSISLTQAGRLIGNRVIDELASCVGQKSLALTIL